MGLVETWMNQGFRDLFGDRNTTLLLTRPGQSNDVVDAIDENDLILLFRGALMGFDEQSASRVFRKAVTGSSILAMVDSSDDVMIHRSVLNDAVKVYFKIEFLNGIYSPRDLYYAHLSYLSFKHTPQLLSIPETLLVRVREKIRGFASTYIEEREFSPTNNKSISVSFLANIYESENWRQSLSLIETVKNRVQIARDLANFPAALVRLGPKHRSGFPHLQYLQLISSSLCSVSALGAGRLIQSTVRYWEIPYSGTVLVSEYPHRVTTPILREGRFVHYFRNSKELNQIVGAVLKDPDECMKAGRLARDYVTRHHSPRARAEAMVANILSL
ncbi:MAG: glycosyltransferase family 1 protein [Nitrososphaerota archaeon]|nr:glycosyltransferase family 1 protein [Nitrososphaerota archaeon]